MPGPPYIQYIFFFLLVTMDGQFSPVLNLAGAMRAKVSERINKVNV